MSRNRRKRRNIAEASFVGPPAIAAASSPPLLSHSPSPRADHVAIEVPEQQQQQQQQPTSARRGSRLVDSCIGLISTKRECIVLYITLAAAILGVISLVKSSDILLEILEVLTKPRNQTSREFPSSSNGSFTTREPFSSTKLI
jgi:hypothetical protein